MYSRYDDIVERVSDTPLWWLNGVPRYAPFRPQDVGVYAREVALVRTQCQECGTRYDVAVQRKMFGSLRDEIAYAGETNYGDPPNGCACSAGATMSASQIVVLEFWLREGRPIPKWVRYSEWERPLVDSDLIGECAPQPVWMRIHASDKKSDWLAATHSGDFATMVAILTQFDCERPLEVAHMHDLERRHRLAMREYLDQAEALTKDRFGEQGKTAE